MNAFLATLITIAVVALVLWAVFKFGPKVTLHDCDVVTGTEDFENKVYTMKSVLPTLLKDHGTRSLKGLMGIFEFELHKQLFVFDDTLAQTLQIYDLGGGQSPRWTVLLPFARDEEGKRFHPYIQFDETLEVNGWNAGHEYPMDYRTKYGKKVLFKDLPWDVQIFILIAIEAPLVEEYELEGEQF